MYSSFNLSEVSLDMAVTLQDVPHSPNVEVLGAAGAPAAAEEAESHFGNLPTARGRKNQMSQKRMKERAIRI